MAKKVHFFKELRIILGSIRFDWQTLVLPSIYDPEVDNEKTRIIKSLSNVSFGLIFGILGVGAAYLGWPNPQYVISNFLIIVFMYIAFCSLMNSLRKKKNNSGRKKKKKIDSFEELLLSSSDFKAIDEYMRKTYSTENLMSSSDCNTLLDLLITDNKVRNKARYPMAQLFIKKYSKYLSFSDPRSVTKAKIFSDIQEEMRNQLFQ